MDNMITIGKIINTQGHLGEVKVMPLTDFPERFEEMDKVFIKKGDMIYNYHIEKTWNHKSFIILKFKEVTDMNSALALKGSLLQVPMEELKDLPEDTYYIFEIIGLEVYDIDNNFLGKVEDVIETGSNDVYVVKRDGARDILVPALKEVVRNIDIKGGKMVVKIPEGLIEE